MWVVELSKMEKSWGLTCARNTTNNWIQFSNWATYQELLFFAKKSNQACLNWTQKGLNPKFTYQKTDFLTNSFAKKPSVVAQNSGPKRKLGLHRKREIPSTKETQRLTIPTWNNVHALGVICIYIYIYIPCHIFIASYNIFMKFYIFEIL